jgi:hypothetical protein
MDVHRSGLLSSSLVWIATAVMGAAALMLLVALL